jgi:hypothetical protein
MMMARFATARVIDSRKVANGTAEASQVRERKRAAVRELQRQL